MPCENDSAQSNTVCLYIETHLHEILHLVTFHHYSASGFVHFNLVCYKHEIPDDPVN